MNVISVADPEHPQEVGFYNTPGSAHGVILSEDGLIYVADYTNVGIYRFTDPAKVDDPAVSIPVKFKLYAAYPNPFNATTTIKYSLSYPNIVSLHLYNPLGQHITTLFNDYRQAGIHSISLNSKNLQSGLYFVRLETTDQIAAQKVILVR
ncbi:MAG: T9SS type A sorting domain-containing protein [Candidatus Hatepunaea meridiana]|nr:T9SS type A sorting domain-containing protein [Candidatus Hatepunaea meridiana]